MKTIIALLAGLAFFGCGKINSQVKTQLAFPNLSFENPVDIQNSGDGSNRLFVVSQPGTIHVFENFSNVSQSKVFLDIRSKVLFGGEQGLLGLAFHPNYKQNGYFYINYTTSNPRRTVISRYKVSADNPDLADKNSELILLEIDQPYSNHNGGQTSFGPDGYLYISLGDGGSGGDPQNYAQNPNSLLGKILRIDVDKNEDGKNYSIPADNPFINSPGFRKEIYAYGLRNVWKFSFDSQTNRLWGADVGQNLIEEINLIEKGGNYGWRCFEGTRSYNLSNCSSVNDIKPIHEYFHNSDGGYSITGGYVYRGSQVSELIGKYIYADFVSSNIWELQYENGKVTNKLIAKSDYAVSTFGVDEKNELYFANYNNGRIYKFVGTPTSKVGSNNIPTDFKLYQNYPNPFNPKTTISYQLLETSHVKLKVFDTMGKVVATLVNEVQHPGIYKVKFASQNIPDSDFLKNLISQSSGVYLYRLMAGNFTETKKMILIK
jgi:glucose/arabinose dehydrogenase